MNFVRVRVEPGGCRVRFMDLIKGTMDKQAPVPEPDRVRSLVLYTSPTCGYCHRVFAHLDRIGVEVEVRDVRADPGAQTTLREKTGRGQVPCLFIDGQPLFESADIMHWLSRYREHVPPSS